MAPIGNTAAFNSIVRFEIPNYGLLKSMFVRVKLSDDAGARVANSYASLQMCDYIEIASQNKVSFFPVFYLCTNILHVKIGVVSHHQGRHDG